MSFKDAGRQILSPLDGGSLVFSPHLQSALIQANQLQAVNLYLLYIYVRVASLLFYLFARKWVSTFQKMSYFMFDYHALFSPTWVDAVIKG